MTELSDNLSSIDSYSVSEISSRDTVIRNELKEDEINFKFYPIRCPNCSKIPRFSADFEKSYFCTNCDLNHKNEYKSFDLFLENSAKDFYNLLCYECQNQNEDFSTIFYCDKCHFFLCSKCHQKHIEETSHLDYISLDKMDNYCSKHDEIYKYYDNNKKKNLCEKCYRENNNNKDIKENIIEISRHSIIKEILKENYYKAKENIKMYNNISRVINEYLQIITNKFNTILNSIKNYCTLQYKIVSYLNFENSYEKYKNNFNAYFNYEIINNEKIDRLIKSINNNINNNYSQNEVCSKAIQRIINILDLLGQVNIEAKKNLSIQKEKVLLPLYSRKLQEEYNAIKVEEMEKKIYEVNSIIKTFIPFDEQKYLVLGLDTGEIQIYEEKEDNENKELVLEKKLEINEFNNEINNLCEIDIDKIVASDIKSNIKIIQLKDNITNYSIIQIIRLEEEESNIYTIYFLPIFSYYKNRHYFCISDNNKILIYNSNKRPLQLNPPGLNYNNKIQEYSIVQPTFMLDDYNLSEIKEYNKKIIEHINEPLSFISELNLDFNIKFNCILEINEKYCVAASSNSNCLKIFNMQNRFKEVTTISNVLCSEGNCILSLSKDRNYLFVGTTIGFNIIIIDNLNRIRKFQLNQKILCLDIYRPEIIVAAILKEEKLYIRQYFFNDEFKNMQKFSEYRIYSEGKINNIRVIKKKIFYINDNNYLVYLKEKENKN